MNSTSSCILLFIVIAFFSLVTNAYSQQSIKALYVTGGGWHDYESQEKLLTKGIQKRMQVPIEWTVIHEGDGEPDHHLSVFQKEAWAEKYDVVVHNTGFGRVTDPEFVNQFVKYHKGTPAVLIHASIHSYRYAEPSEAWFDFMGFQSMWHEDQRPLEVETLSPEHPIMEGIPEKWTTPDDELYVTEEIRGDITPLAQAYGKESEEYHPVSWTYNTKDIRVFATTLGHNNDIYKQEEFMTMVANGLLWAVSR